MELYLLSVKYTSLVNTFPLPLIFIQCSSKFGKVSISLVYCRNKNHSKIQAQNNSKLLSGLKAISQVFIFMFPKRLRLFYINLLNFLLLVLRQTATWNSTRNFCCSRLFNSQTKQMGSSMLLNYLYFHQSLGLCVFSFMNIYVYENITLNWALLPSYPTAGGLGPLCNHGDHDTQHKLTVPPRKGLGPDNGSAYSPLCCRWWIFTTSVTAKHKLYIQCIIHHTDMYFILDDILSDLDFEPATVFMFPLFDHSRIQIICI